jgi:hypothetical protein
MQTRVDGQVLDEGFELLAGILESGPGLALGRLDEVAPDARYDAIWELVSEDADAAGRLVIEAKSRFTPRAIEQAEGYLNPRRLRELGDPTVVILAPWLSPRSRALIEQIGWSYLDLTGNVLLRLRRPAVYIRTSGAGSDPSPRHRGDVLMRGAKINSLIRLLVDFQPPYRLIDLAAAADLSQGYVSRALAALHDQGLVDRQSSGPVTKVDWENLLRYRAREYDLLKSNLSGSFIARSGPTALLRQLGDTSAVVTGSFAASQINPVSAPVQLALYVNSIRAFARQHDLHPTSAGANVLLLQPASASQTERMRLVDGVRHVGYSQLVQDLLSGNGRLPEEGEAVLQWMIDTPEWRLPNLAKIND